MKIKNLDFLAIGVHPDDVELGCGGTILKHIDLGYKVGIVDLTKGELGTRGTATTRKKEAEAARKFAKVAVRENLGMADGFIANNKENKLKIIKSIRKYRPEIILANSVTDRHPDHGNAAKLVSEACFLSGLLKIKTKSGKTNQAPWRPRKVLHYIQDHYIKPDIVVDISMYMDKKIKLVKCFETQFYQKDSKGPKTPISSKSFLDGLRGRSQDFGRRIAVEYGEGFTCHEYIGVSDLKDIL